jgi:hypothetical protein
MKIFHYYLLTFVRHFERLLMIQPKKQMLTAISLVIEQRKNEFDRTATIRFSLIYFYALRG